MELTDFADPHGWLIKSWEPPTNGGAGSIPLNGFVVGGTVIIGRIRNGSQACSLSWLDGDHRLCSIIDLDFNGDNGTLHKDGVIVSFGEGDLKCSVNISLEKPTAPQLPKKFIATVQGLQQDGNAGTFRAEAIPPPPPDPD
jgi:hypothetical protein